MDEYLCTNSLSSKALEEHMKKYALHLQPILRSMY